MYLKGLSNCYAKEILVAYCGMNIKAGLENEIIMDLHKVC